mmetsp:Transcript_18767/g.47383  ORF Transcript_18767/g.47383 Transcript_18767/m.47383 type:complete len:433 (-) Transcript_18767:40-1338(-)
MWPQPLPVGKLRRVPQPEQLPQQLPLVVEAERQEIAGGLAGAGDDLAVAALQLAEQVAADGLHSRIGRHILRHNLEQLVRLAAQAAVAAAGELQDAGQHGEQQPRHTAAHLLDVCHELPHRQCLQPRVQPPVRLHHPRVHHPLGGALHMQRARQLLAGVAHMLPHAARQRLGRAGAGQLPGARTPLAPRRHHLPQRRQLGHGGERLRQARLEPLLLGLQRGQAVQLREQQPRGAAPGGHAAAQEVRHAGDARDGGGLAAHAAPQALAELQVGRQCHAKRNIRGLALRRVGRQEGGLQSVQQPEQARGGAHHRAAHLHAAAAAAQGAQRGLQAAQQAGQMQQQRGRVLQREVARQQQRRRAVRLLLGRRAGGDAAAQHMAQSRQRAAGAGAVHVEAAAQHPPRPRLRRAATAAAVAGSSRPQHLLDGVAHRAG